MRAAWSYKRQNILGVVFQEQNKNKKYVDLWPWHLYIKNKINIKYS